MKKVRFAIAQMNPTVGDYAANARKIIAWVKQAEKKNAQYIVFPELALSGYPLWDLANKKRFLAEGFKSLEKIIQATKGKKIHALIGHVGLLKGVHSQNTLSWIQGGKLRASQAKRLLPTYDVFLEDIFFKPGEKSRVFETKPLRTGPTICEDIWDEDYDVKPLAELFRQKAELFINASASPYYKGVLPVREDLLKRQALKYQRPLLYVNQVGGQDDLIFDGRSLFVNEQGKVLFCGPAFEEGLFFFDWQPQTSASQSLPRSESDSSASEVYRALVLGLYDYCRKNRFEKVLLGLSGGIDSALVASIAADALGKKAVTGVTMPGSYSSEGSWKDSEKLAKNFGIDFRVHPIKKKYEFLVKTYWDQYRQEGRSVPGKGKVTLAMENLQARIRGMELMFISNHEGRLLLTTGNKSELAMGYCTLYGDMAGGLCVLGDVYKTEVYRLARYRNEKGEMIPENTISKPPSAELRPGQKDQDSLPPYELLDEILRLYIEKNYSRDEIIHELKKQGKNAAEIVIDTIRKVDHNEYKRRQTPPLLRVTRKAWFGRRMPITNRFES